MKEKTYALNILLCALWGLLSAAFAVSRAFYPAVIFPAMDLPLLLAVSLTALLLEHWLAPGEGRVWSIMTVLAAVTFGLLPLCAGLVSADMAAKLAAVGGVTFWGVTALFDSMRNRLSSTPENRGALAVGAFVLFLAGQCLTNLFF